MNRASTIIVAAILALGVTRALVRGDAAAGEGISRSDEPLAYWGLVGTAATIALVMLAFAWRA